MLFGFSAPSSRFKILGLSSALIFGATLVTPAQAAVPATAEVAAASGTPTADTPAEDPLGTCNPGTYTADELADGHIIWGTAGVDNLQGSAGDDVICGLGGDDLIDGKAGNDTIIGGAGNDTVYGGLGDDMISGGSGKDKIDAQDGIDDVSGGPDDDTIQGQDGGDSLSGDDGNDTLTGQDGADRIRGGAGNDIIAGTDQNDELDGGPGDDTLDGGTGDDTLIGGAGYDHLDGFRDTDTCSFGEELVSCEIAGSTVTADDDLSVPAAAAKPAVPPAGTITADGLLGGVSVTLNTTGGIAPWDVTATAARSYMDGSISDVLASAAFDLSLPASAPAFTSGTLTIPYDPTTLGTFPVAALRIYNFDEDSQLWLPVPGQQTVDATLGTVTAPISHFSVYAVLKIGASADWLPVFRQAPPRCIPGVVGRPIDAALVIDTSESTTRSDPQDLRVAAAKQFVGALAATDNAGVVGFGSTATVKIGLTALNATGRAAVNTALDSTAGSAGQTNMPDAVSKATTVLSGGAAGRLRIAVLISDGATSLAYDPSVTASAAAAGIEIETVGVGSFDPALLKSIAAGTGGNFHQVTSAADLPALYNQIARDTTDATKDTDGDGLNDCVERNGLFTPGRATFSADPTATTALPSAIVTDPTRADTDGDGLSDGTEVEYRTFAAATAAVNSEYSALAGAGYSGYYKLKSSPARVDTDGDGVTDPAEYAAKTNPLRRESSYLGIAGLDLAPGTLFQPDRYSQRPVISKIMVPVTTSTASGSKTTIVYRDWNDSVRYDGKRNCVDPCPGVTQLAKTRPNNNGHGWCIGNHGDCVTDAGQVRDIVEEFRAQQGIFDTKGNLTRKFVTEQAFYFCEAISGDQKCDNILTSTAPQKTFDATQYGVAIVGVAAGPFPNGRIPISGPVAARAAAIRRLGVVTVAGVATAVTAAEIANIIKDCAKSPVWQYMTNVVPFVHPCIGQPIFSPGADVEEATVHDLDAITGDPRRGVLVYQSRESVKKVKSPTWYNYAGGPCDKAHRADEKTRRGITDIECDELPFFATTTSADRGIKASLKLVYGPHNRNEGTQLGRFYTYCDSVTGVGVAGGKQAPYLVVPRPAAIKTVSLC